MFLAVALVLLSTEGLIFTLSSNPVIIGRPLESEISVASVVYPLRSVANFNIQIFLPVPVKFEPN